MSLNKCIIIGRIGNIKEARQTQSGHRMLNFSVGVSKKKKEQFETTWFNCSVFNKSAEIIEKYYQKGDQIYCEGEVSSRAYQAKDGTLKADLSLFVNEFHKLTSSTPKDAAPQDTPTNTLPFNRYTGDQASIRNAPTFDRYAVGQPASVEEAQGRFQTEDDIPF